MKLLERAGMLIGDLRDVVQDVGASRSWVFTWVLGGRPGNLRVPKCYCTEGRFKTAGR